MKQYILPAIVSWLLCGHTLCQVAFQRSLDSAVELSLEPQLTMETTTSRIVRCGLNQRLPDTKVIYMSLQISDSCDDLHSTTVVAHVNLWTRQPVLESSIFGTNVSADIDLDDDAIPHLSVHQDDTSIAQCKQPFYICVIHVVNIKAEPQTATRCVKDPSLASVECKPDENSLIVETTPRQFDNITRLLDSIYQQLKSASSKENLRCDKNDVTTINHTLEKLRTDVEEQAQKVNDRLKAIDEVIEDYGINSNIKRNQSEDVNKKLAGFDTAIMNKLEDVHQTFRYFKTNESNKIETIENQVEGMNTNVSNQLELIYQAIKNQTINDNLESEINKDAIDKLSKQVGASNVTDKVQVLNENIGTLNTAMQELNDRVVEFNTSVVNELPEELKKLDDKMEVVDSAMKGLENKVAVLDTAVHEISNTMEGINTTIKNLEMQMQSVINILQSLDMHLTYENFDFPNASHTFKGKSYLFTKDKKEFDITEANDVCQEHGGYLVDFEDEDEYDFVSNIVVAEKGEQYFTGYTDSGEEGSYVHIHTGAPLTVDRWAPGQPNNLEGKQDCVDIFRKGGLNDQSCSKAENYICKVPRL